MMGQIATENPSHFFSNRNNESLGALPFGGSQNDNSGINLNNSNGNISETSKGSAKSKLGQLFANINSKIMQKIDSSASKVSVSQRT